MYPLHTSRVHNQSAAVDRQKAPSHLAVCSAHFLRNSAIVSILISSWFGGVKRKKVSPKILRHLLGSADKCFKWKFTQTKYILPHLHTLYLFWRGSWIAHVIGKTPQLWQIETFEDFCEYLTSSVGFWPTYGMHKVARRKKKHIVAKAATSMIPVQVLVAVQGFEPRTLRIWVACSTTWATPPW